MYFYHYFTLETQIKYLEQFRFVWPDSGFRHRGTANDHAAASSSRPTAVALPTLGPRSPPPSHFQAKGTRAHNDLAQHCAGWDKFKCVAAAWSR